MAVKVRLHWKRLAQRWDYNACDDLSHLDNWSRRHVSWFLTELNQLNRKPKHD